MKLNLLLVVVLYLLQSSLAQEQATRKQTGDRRAKGQYSRRPYLKVFNHRPCLNAQNGAKYDGPWDEFLRFPSKADGVNPEPDPKKPGCYRIKGTVDVKQRIARANDIQIYLDVHHGLANEGELQLPEQCKDSQDGCGGVGSCLYCETCAEWKDGKAEFHSLTRAHIEVNEEPLKCHESLDAGFHDNVSLHFCLPNKREFLRQEGLSEDIWDQIVAKRGGGISTMITFYVFQHHVNNLFKQQQQILNSVHLNGQTLTPHQFYSLPFNEMVYKHRRSFVGCHELFGSMYMQPSADERKERFEGLLAARKQGALPTKEGRLQSSGDARKAALRLARQRALAKVERLSSN